MSKLASVCHETWTMFFGHPVNSPAGFASSNKSKVHGIRADSWRTYQPGLWAVWKSGCGRRQSIGWKRSHPSRKAGFSLEENLYNKGRDLGWIEEFCNNQAVSVFLLPLAWAAYLKCLDGAEVQSSSPRQRDAREGCQNHKPNSICPPPILHTYTEHMGEWVGQMTE